MCVCVCVCLVINVRDFVTCLIRTILKFVIFMLFHYLEFYNVLSFLNLKKHENLQ